MVNVHVVDNTYVEVVDNWQVAWATSMMHH